MRKLLSLLLGLTLGFSAAVILVTLFSPVSGAEVRQNLRDHVNNAREAGRIASAKKRAELEADLQRMRQR